VNRINHLAVLAAAIVFFLLGALWYTVLFGRLWTTLESKAPTPVSSMTTTFIITFILGWVLAYVIAIALADTNHPNPPRHGVEFGVFMGLGIFGTMLGLEYVNEGRPFLLWLINAGYIVVGMAVMGAIVGAWRPRGIIRR